MKSPIFLFSLPRSGSTLLQRVLMSHSNISSLAEPWLLLPFTYMLKNGGIVSEYSCTTSNLAISDFINNLPNKEEDYFQELKVFINALYEKQCQNNDIYFLDKTPRYYLIIEEINKIFPDAKFVFLFRNPVHVFSSIVSTWGNNRLNKLYKNQMDLEKGMKLLSNGYSQFKEKSYALNYEEFIKNPKKHLKDLCFYLDIEYQEKMLESFSTQNTKGRVGDPTGIKEYKTIDLSPLEKWKNVFNTTYRKKLLIQYIDSIDSNIYTTQGYSKKKIFNEIKEHKVFYKLSLKDRLDFFISNLILKTKINLFMANNHKKYLKNKYIS